MEAHFDSLNIHDLEYIKDLIELLNNHYQKHSDWPIHVPFIKVCNDVAEQIGVIHFNTMQDQFVFVADFTGDGIDTEKLKW